MFIGHFGAGFAGKAGAPRTSLGTLFLAAQFLDLIWPTLLLLGLEQVRVEPGNTRVTPLNFVSYPISHSLLLVICWAILFAGIYWGLRRYSVGALMCGALVISHWILDLVVHRPDLPLRPGGGPKFGLELWSSLPATLIVEGAVFAAGLALYARSTRAKDRAGTYGLIALVILLLVIYAGNLAGSAPPSVKVIAWAGQAQWLLVAAAYWLDRHRAAVGY